MLDENVRYKNRIVILGEVHLILEDGRLLSAEEGIHVDERASLTVYAQSTGKSMGEIIADASDENERAGIGGDDEESGGKIVINGGRITAKGGMEAAGVGSGNEGSEGHIFISGGKLDATGGYEGAGIGGGEGSSGGKITINGGTIEAHGGGNEFYSDGGAGIGGGADGGEGGTIRISGGNIEAYGGSTEGWLDIVTGGSGGAGIGGGADGSNGTLRLGDDTGSFIDEGGNRYTPIAKGSRDSACRKSEVVLKKCPHVIDGYANLHEKGHRRSCKYCYVERLDQEKPQAHEIDGSSLKCVCGYCGVLLSFRPGTRAQGSMSPEILTGNTVYLLPAPTFDVSRHYTFAGWMIGDSLYDAGEEYTTPQADSAIKEPVAVAQWLQTAHEWGEWTVSAEPTETEEGVETRVCNIDPAHVDTRSIPKTDHRHDAVLTKVESEPATCTDSGQKEYYTCSGCTAIFEDENAETRTSEEGIWIQAKRHTRGEPVIDEESRTVPTCSSVGGYNTVTRCTTCDAVLRTVHVVIPFDPDAHAWGEWVVTREATADEEGLEVRTCKYDSSHTEERSIPKTGPEPAPGPSPDDGGKGDSGSGGASAAAGAPAGTVMNAGGSMYVVKSADTAYLKKAAGGKTFILPAEVQLAGKTYIVAGIEAKAFKGTRVRTLTVRTRYLTKKSVRGSLKGSAGRRIIQSLS